MPDIVSDVDTLQCFRQVQSQKEVNRQIQFVFKLDRHLYLVSHGLLRMALSKYVDVQPADWEFSEDKFGKPEVVGAHSVHQLCFNLTHTAGLAAVAVCLT